MQNIKENKICLVTRIAIKEKKLSETIANNFLKNILGEQFIHSELWFPTYLAGAENSFSSRGRIKNCTANKKGVQFAKVDYNVGKWIFTPLSRIPKSEYENIYALCLELVGREYDTLGAIFNCGFGFKKVDKVDKDWCSEVIASVIGMYYGIKNDNFTPGQLFRRVKGQNTFTELRTIGQRCNLTYNDI